MERSAHSLLLLLLAAGLVVALLPAAAATFGPQPGAPCEAALLATQVQLFCTPDAPTTLCCDPVVAAFDLGGGVPCLCRVAAEPQLVMAGLNATHLLALYTSCGGIRPGGAHLAAACQGPAPPAAVVSSPPPPSSAPARTNIGKAVAAHAAATFGPQPGAPCDPALLATQAALFCAPDMATAQCCEPVVAAVDLGGGVPCLCRVAAEPPLVMAGLNASHLLKLYTSCGGLQDGARFAAACEGPAPPAAVVSSPPPPPPPSPAPRRKQAAHMLPSSPKLSSPLPLEHAPTPNSKGDIAPAPAPLPSHHASAAELSLLWIGCFFSAGLYLWPIPIMFAICGGGALGQVKVDPFIFTVTNSATWILYAVSHNPFNGVLLIINAVGALLEIFYICIVLWYSSAEQRVKTGMVIFVTAATLVFFSLGVFFNKDAHTIFGLLADAGSIAMYCGGPVRQMMAMWREKNTDHVSLTMVAATSLNAFSWMLYGVLRKDGYLIVASSVGIVSGIVQLGFVLLVMYQIEKAQPGQVEALLALVQVQVQAAQAQAAQAAQAEAEAQAQAQAQAEAEAQAQAHAEAQAQAEAEAQAAQAQAEAEAQAQAHAEDQAQAAQAQAEV